MAAGKKQTSHQLLCCVCVWRGGGSALSAIIIMTILNEDMSGTPKCALIVTMTSGSAHALLNKTKYEKERKSKTVKGI